MNNIKILVATHKKYKMPDNDIYLPLHVGREGKEDLGYQGDNTGDNISIKNQSYCELTGLYWAWKNLDCDYIGLCHYRRYFTTKKAKRKSKTEFDNFNSILNEQEIKELMGNSEILLPSQRNYYIETIWSHYKNAHHIKDLQETQNIIEKLYPDYLNSFNEVMSGKKLHLYNMFVMKKSDFDSYCEWLFTILFELEKRTDLTTYDAYQKRIFGFMSERLFNVWIHKKGLKISKLKILSLEGIKWGDKIYKFLARKVS
ncbi:DUF4422 domain-containing protein [Planomicrobium sp. CPCC 101110]|uniref:DUF4422 domain-containing protein n=1 Tax=Planomicrobium sp. CPCC 101110 TaxID=2599619 RepID=UPI0011B4ECE9|nr:DUF4422 domain-containing protein [Planomicrobium sp. CPCC 101110]TWT27717.1 DUF4422 domain-containing protein [Planomicrobium sp. CPCC 101110]